MRQCVPGSVGKSPTCVCVEGPLQRPQKLTPYSEIDLDCARSLITNELASNTYSTPAAYSCNDDEVLGGYASSWKAAELI